MDSYWCCGLSRDGGYLRHGPFASYEEALREAGFMAERDLEARVFLYRLPASVLPVGGDGKLMECIQEACRRTTVQVAATLELAAESRVREIVREEIAQSIKRALR